jgi:hypothetical protein
MSGGKSCQCSEKREPLTAPAGSNRPGRLWRVIQYRCNHSAFNGYHHTSSDYSSISCLRCGAYWRTKAPYADMLTGRQEGEQNIERGYPGHAEAMVARGREPE